MSRNPVQTRERICHSAMQLAIRDGLMTLTLDNVAVEAGLSKGGVMHHFPSKEALLEGVIEHFGTRLERELTRVVSEDDASNQRWVRAILKMLFSGDPTDPQPQRAKRSKEPSPSTSTRFMMSVLALAIHDRQLANPVRAIGQRLRQRLLSNPDEGIDQLMSWLVIDGLFLWELVGLIDRTDPLYDRVIDELKQRVGLEPSKTPSKPPSKTNAATMKLQRVGSIPTKKVATASRRRRGSS
jgi:AcrR family transcriptional regulator